MSPIPFARAFAARADALFVERDVYLRSHDRVRYIRITRALQLRIAAGIAAVLVAWTALAGFLFLSNSEATASARQQAAVVRAEAAVTEYRRSSGAMAQDLRRRQQVIEQLLRDELAADGVQAAKGETLAAIAARQDRASRALAAAFDTRSRDAAQTLRRLGLNPAAMAARGGQGGPLVPIAAASTPAMAALLRSAARWSVLRDNLGALPSSLPTDGTPVSSSFGVRGDPFTGQAAFHAGIDFTGAYRQQILAAAPGRVAFVGQRSGYGNVVEIDHGHGMMTRYAHLAAADVPVGRAVARGDRIAQMGSTGRSTGTHLHFEVHVNGRPVNPVRFLAVGK